MNCNYTNNLKHIEHLSVLINRSMKHQATASLVSHSSTVGLMSWEDETNVQEYLHMVKWGVQQVASEPPRALGYYGLFAYINVQKLFCV